MVVPGEIYRVVIEHVEFLVLVMEVHNGGSCTVFKCYNELYPAMIKRQLVIKRSGGLLSSMVVDLTKPWGITLDVFSRSTTSRKTICQPAELEKAEKAFAELKNTCLQQEKFASPLTSYDWRTEAEDRIAAKKTV